MALPIVVFRSGARAILASLRFPKCMLWPQVARGSRRKFRRRALAVWAAQFFLQSIHETTQRRVHAACNRRFGKGGKAIAIAAAPSPTATSR